MYPRLLNILPHLQKRSLFLFGPRSTGKSTLLKLTLPHAAYYDLLDNEVYNRLLRRPAVIAEECSPEDIVVIDEVQKLPQLLDEAHRLISSRGQRFVLTGSSARKLKRGASNLLAGRARWLQLFPLVSREIPNFNLDTYLKTGGLPNIYGEEDANIDLKSYVDLYIREEVQAESLTRNIQGYARLLDVLALMNGEELNYAAIASDTGLQAKTVVNYIEILEDTLLAFRLPVFKKTKKRKPSSRPKLYFFDVGIVHALRKSFIDEIPPELFGKVFEHFIVLEVRACTAYYLHPEELTFWRSRTGFEVDLIIGETAAIEIKAARFITDKHLKGIRALKEEFLMKRYIVVSRDSSRRNTEDGIDILPWDQFLEELWNRQIF